MFVFVSKIVWFVLQPVSLILLLGLVSLALGFTRFRRLSLTALAASIALLGLSAFTSLGYVVIQPLEQRFSRPVGSLPKVDGIIVLGGGMDAEINDARGGYELNRSGDRFTEALRLARLYPDARIVVSGGAGVFLKTEDTEAEAGARFFSDFGISPGRILMESRARNTEENAQFTRDLIGTTDGRTWLLVTSAYHMPRSIGLFRRAGLAVVPWPTDYFSSGTETIRLKLDQPAENLAVVTIAVREWAGLAAYWLTGRIGDLVPAPR